MNLTSFLLFSCFLLSPGWLAKLETTNADEEIADLMTEEQYRQYIINES